MKKLFVVLLLLTQLFGGENMSIYEIVVKDIDAKGTKLEKYKDKVMLIVNVASKCGYTSQYTGLQKLHEQYNAKGLSILGLPCNQFLSQEPGTEEEIKNFCMSSFGVEFDMFSKVDVNGENTHPLYIFLKKNSDGFLTDTIKWNFTKFLVDRKGKVVKRYSPSTTPLEIEEDIKKLL
ncbi:MAG: glutathione peroxidase [Sulfurimonas sp.]|jgi:glutathione peroxidase|uniref:glutathione peroxidase n=1 Tax=Sulfurimonas sp. TaxID=2022749 RepID=UPI0039E6A5A9